MPSTTDIRWFKSAPVESITNAQFDREKGTINDVVLCQVGPAKGHGVHLDQGFVNDVVAYATENYESIGLKSRFGHPSMSDTAMGTQLGYFKNFRVRGEQAIADFQVLQAAKNSKNGNMWEWLFDMAEEKPDYVMNSIVFKQGDYYKYIDGEKKKSSDYENIDEFWDTPGDDKKLYIEMSELLFADLVEQGAATDSLFSSQFNKDKFAVLAHEFLNEHTELDEFVKENPEKIYAFLKQRGITIEKTSWFKKLQGLFGLADGTDELVESLERERIDRQQLETMLDAANTQITSLVEKIKELEAQAVALNQEIERLNKLPAVEDVGKFKKTPSEPKKQLPPWHKDNFI